MIEKYLKIFSPWMILNDKGSDEDIEGTWPFYFGFTTKFTLKNKFIVKIKLIIH